MTAASQKHRLFQLPHSLLRFHRRLPGSPVNPIGRLSIVVLLLTGALVIIFTARFERQIWLDRQQEVSRSAASSLGSILTNRQRELALIGLIEPDVLQSYPQTGQAHLSEPEGWVEITRLDRAARSIFTVGGQAFYADLIASSKSAWFLQAGQGRNYIGQIHSATGDRPDLILAVPAENGGVLAGRIDLRPLCAPVDQIHLGQTGLAYIVDVRTGAILCPEPAGPPLNPGRDHPLTAALSSAPAQAWSGRYHNTRGISVLGRVTPIPGVDWVLVTELPIFETRQILHLTIAGFAIALLALWSLITFIGPRLALRQNAVAGVTGSRPEHQPGPSSDAYHPQTARPSETEQRLVITRNQAFQANRLKSELLANVSHELRTPLGVILGFAEMLRDGRYGPLSPQQREPLAHIIQSTGHLNQMVNNLLDQSRLDARQLRLTPVLIRPGDLLDEIIGPLAHLAQKKGLALDTVLARDLPSAFYGDPVRLRQIIINLVDNAIKFTASGLVTLRVYRPGPDHWAIQVTDSGCGIPPEANRFIFEPFRQVDGSATREHNGAGLGLSIVRQLVDLMHGRILLDSQVGSGSSFTVLLPIVLDPRNNLPGLHSHE